MNINPQNSLVNTSTFLIGYEKHLLNIQYDYKYLLRIIYLNSNEIVEKILKIQNRFPSTITNLTQLIQNVYFIFPEFIEITFNKQIVQLKQSYKYHLLNICKGSLLFMISMIEKKILHKAIMYEILIMSFNQKSYFSLLISLYIMKLFDRFNLLNNTDVLNRIKNEMKYYSKSILDFTNKENRIINLQNKSVINFKINKSGNLLYFSKPMLYLCTLRRSTCVDKIKNNPHYKNHHFMIILELFNYLHVIKKINEHKYEKPAKTSGTSDIKKAINPMGVKNTKSFEDHMKKNIYLLIMSSLSPDEILHKIFKLKVSKNLYVYISTILIEAFISEKSYKDIYTKVAEKLCKKKTQFKIIFEESYCEIYKNLHKLSSDKTKMIAQFFSYLISTNSISSNVLNLIHFSLTNSISIQRIFIKYLLLGIKNHIGKLNMITFFKNFYIKNSSISFFKQNNENERVLVEKFLYSINIGFLVNHARAETNECLKPTIYS